MRIHTAVTIHNHHYYPGLDALSFNTIHFQFNWVLVNINNRKHKVEIAFPH